MSSTAPLLLAYNAQQLAAAAAALAAGQNGRGLAVTARALADSARAFADSPGDQDAAARLADAAAAFTEASAADNAPPDSSDEINAVVHAAAQFLPGRRHAPTPRSRSSDDDDLVPRSARTLASAAALLAVELRGTALAATAKAFADRARGLAATPGDLEAAAKLVDAAKDLAAAAAGTPQAAAVSGLLRAVHTIVSAHDPRASSCFEVALGCFGRGVKNQEEDVVPTPKLLGHHARRLAESAAGTSMAEDAAAFSNAVHNFVSGKGKDNTELIKAGDNLATAAVRAPDSELDIAATAVSLTEDSKIAWISECDRAGLRRGGWWASLLRRLRAAISGPEPTLPTHRSHAERQEKQLDKRQVLFGVALVAPVALLTSAASTHIFPAPAAPWIAGTTAFVWIAVSGAVVANLYGQTDFELQAASCLGRLGVMSVAVLFGVYTVFAFFPSVTAALVLLVGFAVALHGCLYATSRLRGDDQISDSSSRGADETGCE